MHMHLDDLIVIHQHQAVAQLTEERPERFGILVVLPVDNELGAVGEGDVLGVEIGEIRSFLNIRGIPSGFRHHILTLQG